MKQKALVIDDNEDNIELIAFILKAGGFECEKAETGYKGYELAISNSPDFILLDIQLPDLDGIEVLKKIRAHKAGASIPIIAVTSFAMAGDRERLLQAGCDGYLEKPIDPDRILDQIRNFIEEKNC